jgi:hypothetical protein
MTNLPKRLNTNQDLHKISNTVYPSSNNLVILILLRTQLKSY